MGTKQSYTLSELAVLTHSQLIGNGGHVITNVADLVEAQAEDASFLANPRYLQAMNQSQAGVIFIHPQVKTIPGKNFLVNDNPSQAFQKVVEFFFHEASTLTGFKDIHPTAVIHESAQLGLDVQIGPYAVIDKDAVVGNQTFIGSHCYIGPKTLIGQGCIIHPHVTIRERCLIGDRVIIQPGTVIGSCGFGYLTNQMGQHTKLNQVGTVTLQDDVEIGANAAIDRSRFKTTLIKRGTKVDNLVQIAHGVILGEDNLIVAQTGIAGSTQTGKHVVMGGQTAVAGHLKIHDGVMLAGRSGVSKSLNKPGKYNGAPVMPIEEYNRNAVLLRNIEKFIAEFKEFKKNFLNIENNTN